MQHEPCHETVTRFLAGRAHSHRMYIAVGSWLTAEQLRRIAPERLIQRDLWDPRFAGVEVDFDWRTHLDIAIAEPAMRARIEATLDQLATAPEGQHLIRQAAANQQVRARQAQAPSRIRMVMGEGNQFDGQQGMLFINHQQMARYAFESIGDTQVAYSYQHTLIHELFHAADGLNTPHHKELLNADAPRLATHLGVNARDSFSLFMFRIGDMGRHYMETPAIRATNSLMQRFFCEPPRISANAVERTDLTLDPVGPDLFYGSPASLPRLVPASCPGHRR